MQNENYPSFPIAPNTYAAFDAISLRNLIIERLNAQGTFTDQNYIGSNLASIIDIVAYAFNTLLFYLNRTSSEATFTEAQVYENINRIVKLLDYKPVGYQTSTLAFQVSADNRNNTFEAANQYYTIPRYSYLIVSGIPFSFNEHDLENVKQLAQDLGIDKFVVNPSERFDDQTMHFKPKENLIGVKWNAQQNWKQTPADKKINPECFNGLSTHFISADGYYMPCCHIGDHRFYYKTEFGKNRKQYSIMDTTFSEILNRKKVEEFYNTLAQHKVCQYNCGE